MRDCGYRVKQYYAFVQITRLLICCVLLAQLTACASSDGDSDASTEKVKSFSGRFSQYCNPEKYYFEKDAADIVIFGPEFTIADNERWVLERYHDWQWESVYAFHSGDIRETEENRYAFDLTGTAGSLLSGQYRMAEATGGQTSGTFCIGDLEELTSAELDTSPYAEYPENAGITMAVKAEVPAGSRFIKYTLINETDKDASFGCGAYVEVLKNGSWCRMPNHKFLFEQVLHYAPAGGSYSEVLVMDVYDFELCEGTYRVIKPYSFKIDDTRYCTYAEFEITQSGTDNELPVLKDCLELTLSRETTDMKGKRQAVWRNLTEDTVMVYASDNFWTQALSEDTWIDVEKWKPTHIHFWQVLAPGESTREFSVKSLDSGQYRYLVLCELSNGDFAWAETLFEIE